MAEVGSKVGYGDITSDRDMLEILEGVVLRARRGGYMVREESSFRNGRVIDRNGVGRQHDDRGRAASVEDGGYQDVDERKSIKALSTIVKIVTV